MSILESTSPIKIEYPPEQTIHEYFLRKARDFSKHGRTESLMDLVNEKIYNFSDYDHLSGIVAKSFWKRGLRKGDIVIFTTSDVGIFYSILLGIWRANGIARGIYPEENAETILSKIDETNSHWLICDISTANDLISNGKLPPDVTLFVFGQEIPKGCCSVQDLLIDDPEIEIPKSQGQINDPVLIMPTSGTTGPSKGCVLNNRNMIYACLLYEVVPFSGDITKPLLWFSKTTHISGAQYCMGMLSTGQYMIRANFSVERLLETIPKYKIENLFVVTPLLVPLVHDPRAKNYDFSSVKHINCGAAVMKEEFYKELLSSLPGIETIAIHFGMTEVSLTTSTIVPNPDQKRLIYEGSPLVSIGKLIPQTSLKVRDTETGELLGQNQKGELLFQNDSVFYEYYKNPVDTAKTILPGNWIATGDFGYFDENGFVYLEDRVKETFKGMSTGNHISPSELENVILMHEAVAECLVVPEPFEQVGNPRAFITLKAGCSASSELEEEVKLFANSKLSSYKHLHGGVFIIPSLPRGNTGKIARRNLANFKR